MVVVLIIALIALLIGAYFLFFYSNKVSTVFGNIGSGSMSSVNTGCKNAVLIPDRATWCSVVETAQYTDKNGKSVTFYGTCNDFDQARAGNGKFYSDQAMKTVDKSIDANAQKNITQYFEPTWTGVAC